MYAREKTCLVPDAIRTEAPAPAKRGPAPNEVRLPRAVRRSRAEVPMKSGTRLKRAAPLSAIA